MTDDRDNDRNNQERVSWELRQKASSYNYYPPPPTSLPLKLKWAPTPTPPHFPSHPFPPYWMNWRIRNSQPTNLLRANACYFHHILIIGAIRKIVGGGGGG